MATAKGATKSKRQPLITILDSTEAITRLNERLLELYEMTPSDEIVDAMVKAWEEMKAAGRSKSVKNQQLAVAKIDTLMKEASEGSQRRKEIYKLEDQIDRMRDRALRRAMVEGTYVKLQDARAVMHNWISAIRIVVQKTLIESGHTELARDIIGLVAAEYEAVCGVLPDIAERQSPQQRDRTLKQQSKEKKKQPKR